MLGIRAVATLLVLFVTVFASAQKTVDTITINGVTGQVTGGSSAPYGPDQFVEVRIAPANLIAYAYTVTVDNSEQLKAFIPPIVGAADATVTPGRSGPFDFTLDLDLFQRALPANKSLIDEYRATRRLVQDLVEDTGESIVAVDEAERRIDRALAASSTVVWPPELDSTRSLFLIGAFGSDDLTPRAAVVLPQVALDQLRNTGEGICSANSLCQRAAVAARAVQTLQDHIEDAKLRDASAQPDQTKRQDFSLIEDAAEALATAVTTVRSGLARTRDRVDRWKAITTRYATPQLSQRVLIDRVSRRYVVTVTRRPVNAPLPATGQPDTAAERLASTMFEGHTLSRLLFATGIGVLYRPDVRTFEVQTRLDGDTKKFFVAQKSSTKTEFKPMMTIGAYLKPVDNFVVNEKWTPRTFVSVGTELATSPSTYLLGAGLDFPAGVTLNGGITSYEGSDLGEGYIIGQEIPGTGTGADRAPLVSTAALPLRTRRLVGYYISVQFRPAIFSAFRSLVD